MLRTFCTFTWLSTRKLNERLIFLETLQLSKSMPSPFTGGEDQGEEGHSKVLKVPKHGVLRPNSWAKCRRKSSEFSSLLFTATFTALP